MVATLLAVCVWYLLKDFDKFRAISVARVCYEAADCNYRVPFLALAMLSAVVILVGNLAMLPGRKWAACLFPAAATVVMWATIQMTARYWSYDEIWLDFVVISHACLLVALAVPKLRYLVGRQRHSIP